MPITRRQVLALGALSAAVATAGVGGTVASWWGQPPGAPLQHLSAGEAAFIRALAEVAYPATAAIPVGAAALGLDVFLDDAMGALPGTPRKLVKLLLNALDAWPVPRRFGTFSTLSVEDRLAVMDHLQNHWNPQIRQGTSSLLLLIGMGYCTHPQVSPFFSRWHGCGYGR
jgi:hypothetical protein